MIRKRIERIQKLLATESIIITNVLESGNANSDRYLKETFANHSCECGVEILVVPDLKAMNWAIKTHVAEHRKERKEH